VDNRSLQDGLSVRVGKSGPASDGIMKLVRTRILSLGQR
jgi:hypothetical protein